MHSQGVQPYIILNIINFNSCIPGGMQLGILSSRSPNYDFNSCIPGGMQPILLFRLLHQSEFQFMHPGWDATIENYDRHEDSTISIHASRVGCNDIYGICAANVQISIHASRVGCNCKI